MQEIEKGLTLRAYLIGIILVVVWTILIHLLGGFTAAFPEATANSVIFGIFTMFLFSLVASKLKLTAQEHTAIYAMILVSTVFAATWTFTIYGQVIMAIGQPIWSEYGLRHMPSIFGPRDQDLILGANYNAFAGGTQVPWDAWLIPMFYWMLLSLAICFSGLFLSCIMRRQYIDVETLPFPIATPILTLTKGPSFSRLPNIKYTLVGMLIGFVWPPTLFAFLNTLHPPLSLPTIGSVDLGPTLWSILPMAVLSINWGNLAVLAFAFLVPKDILLTAVVLHFIFLWIIPPIEVGIGTLTANPDYAAPDQWLFRFADAAFKGAVHNQDILRYGGMLGLGIIPLIFQWRYIGRSLKAIIHPKPEVETHEPLPYRWAWIGYIATSILSVFLMYIGGMPVWIAIIFFVLFNVLILGFTRLRGESGGWVGNADEMISPIHATLYQIGFASGIESEAVKSTCWSSLALAGTYTWWGFAIAFPPTITSMEAFRIASLTKTRSRDLFVAISIAIIVAIFIGFPFALWGIYKFGVTARWRYSRIDGSFIGDMGWSQNLRLAFWSQGLPAAWHYPLDWIQILFGVILVGVFTFMRTRFMWFPLNPIGIPLAGFVLSPGYIFLWLVAYIIKYGTLKIGGTKLYEERGIPIAVGIIVIWATLLFTTGLIDMFRAL